MSTIFTNGVFDLLTPGHYSLLSTCRALAGPEGRVIVAIDSDRKTREDKGTLRPFFTETERSYSLLNLKSFDDKSFCHSVVDEVVVFDSNEELYSLIQAIAPDKIVKGDDWYGKVIGSDVAPVCYYPVDSNFSTTKIADRIVSKFFDNMQQDYATTLRTRSPSVAIDPFDRLDEK